MSFTGDTEIPSKNPFSPEYKEWLGNLASDVAKLNKYLPLFDFADVPTGSGGGGGGNVFLARILSGGLESPYTFAEVSSPDDITLKDGGRSGIAYNTMQTGLVTSSENLYVPPGFDVGCFNDVFSDGATVEFRVLPVAVDTIVHMAQTTAETDEDPNSENPYLYSFSVPLPICVRCTGLGDEG